MFNTITGGVLAKAVVYIKVDSIVVYTSWIIIAIASLILYILAVSQWLPSLLIAKRRVSGKVSDRGIKKYVFSEGRSVVYEPGRTSRGYMKKYMLFCYKDKKYMRCLFDDAVRSAYFEMLVYNNQNKIIKIADVYIPVGETHYSESILLPDDAAYVNLTLFKINGVSLPKNEEDVKWLKGHMLKRRLIYSALATFITFVESSFILSVIRYFLNLFLQSSFKTTFEQYVGTTGEGFNIIVTILVSAFVSISGIVIHLKNN